MSDIIKITSKEDIANLKRGQQIVIDNATFTFNRRTPADGSEFSREFNGTVVIKVRDYDINQDGSINPFAYSITNLRRSGSAFGSVRNLLGSAKMKVYELSGGVNTGAVA